MKQQMELRAQEDWEGKEFPKKVKPFLLQKVIMIKCNLIWYY